MKRIVIRTDASLQMGSGHVMRCLTLADELRQRGTEILFVCREHPGNLIEMIHGKGYRVARLLLAEAGYTATIDDVAHATWLGCSWQHDAAETIEALGGIQPEWLIIDHYAIDYRWERELRPHIGNIMVIDDLADRQHDSDVLLDQNLYQSMEVRYKNLVPGACRKLLGPKYALLRPEFVAARRSSRLLNGEVKRVLVFFGGSDPTNETEKTLQALAGIGDRQFAVDVVVGASNSRKSQIQDFCAGYHVFSYYCQVSNMAELMTRADLAVGAGGATTWERCFLGLPSLVMSIAANQVELSREVDRCGAILYVGEADTIKSASLTLLLTQLISNPFKLKSMSERGMSLLDGSGAARVARSMVDLI